MHVNQFKGSILNTITTDVLIIGAGAAGLMCAIEAGRRHRQVHVIDHANKVGKKILMSGGGHCNFTNLHIRPECYLSQNPHFCKSALSRYTQWDFIELVEKHKIGYQQKKWGQLFCLDKAKVLVNMLLAECVPHPIEIQLQESVSHIGQKADGQFEITTSRAKYCAESLVIATGGLSIPTLGASAFGYQVAEQFNIPVRPTRAALVPLTLHTKDKARFAPLSGISAESIVTSHEQSFRENILFTHRGLSGPAILQISNYWQPGGPIAINLWPEWDIEIKAANGKQHLGTFLSSKLPKRLTQVLFSEILLSTPINQFNPSQINEIKQTLCDLTLIPNGTEGYRTAEVTQGGIDCNALSSKTFETRHIKGLYFIGEVLDVTGWLGGYNFQWAWSSGWAAGQVV